MALYENGKRISGIRDFPAYTWAAYHALPVAKRPKVWKCTDRDYSAVKNGSTRVTVINDTSGTTNNQQTLTMTKNGYVWIQAAQSSSDIYCGFSLRVNGLDVFGVWQDGQAEAKPYRTYCFSFPVYKGDVVRFQLNHAKGSCGYVECE